MILVAPRHDVIGFLHVRDLLGVTLDDTRTVSEIARPILTLPGTKPVPAIRWTSPTSMAG